MQTQEDQELLEEGLLLLIVTVTLALYRALALYLAWTWHLVPLGVPPLSFAHAFFTLVALRWALRSFPFGDPHEASLSVVFWGQAVGVTVALILAWGMR